MTTQRTIIVAIIIVLLTGIFTIAVSPPVSVVVRYWTSPRGHILTFRDGRCVHIVRGS